ncbi:MULTISPECIES: ExbD/TolR family protein [Sphingobacterium]|uniref:Biopolymer transporter ExbD n=1 Tax=Sphingobacterium athyrii TaxID=2152717 RepID=A0A363NJU1_9SPHI|nr:MULTISPECIES: biopolymer transporter ExbD [Sphingobacterium]PUV21088.1 biopolymer transporter ExbD [Sphingobacterium athyrii]QIH32313.1 biopolymer transporter ExbD [Sphingobacterium sp. DR205]
MAELNQKTRESGKKKIRSRKMAPKVDLTAMVDLAFLLITFFMLTTTLNKPAAMDIAMPDKTKDDVDSPVFIDENRTATLILGDGKFMWYHGDFKKPIASSEKPADIEKTLAQVVAQLKGKISTMPNTKDMIVLIKPSKEARTKDVIRTIDELKHQNISRYVIGKTQDEEEKQLLASIQ